MKVSKTQLSDMLGSLESCLRILKRLEEDDVDFQSLRTAATLLSQTSAECREIIGAERYEYNLKRNA